MPKQAHDICQLFFDGKVKESAELQLKLLPLINALFIDVNPIPVKEAMNLIGWKAGLCRLPLAEMSESAKAHLVAELKNAGLMN